MTKEEIRKEAEKVYAQLQVGLYEPDIDLIESLCLKVRNEALEEAAKEIEESDDTDHWGEFHSKMIRALKEDKK